MKYSKFFVFALFLPVLLSAQKQQTYKKPPQGIIEIAKAAKTPNVSIDPNREWIIELYRPGYNSIQTISEQELRLGGIRINPKNLSQSRAYYYDSISLISIGSGKDYFVKGVPKTGKFGNLTWSPNGKFVAFTNTTQKGVELWLLDVQKKQVEKILNDHIVNSLPNNPITWLDKGEWLVVTAEPGEKIDKPVKSEVPTGPIVREATGKKAAVRTYQDLLKDKYDSELFEYYTTSQLLKVNVNKESYKIGVPAIFKHVSVSPNGEFILVKMIKKPFSYLVPYYRFPFISEVWDAEGNLRKELFKIPAAENIPQGFDAVRKGPRNINWRTDKPAELYWVYAMDGGDPSKKVVVRDRLFLLSSPFDGDGLESITFEKRFDGIDWGNSTFAIVYESWWGTRLQTVSSFNPETPEKNKELLFEYDWQDEYKHPGYFLTKRNETGNLVLAFGNKGTELYLSGKGGTPEGYKPFFDKYIIASKTTERLWQSSDPYYEKVICDIDIDKELILTRRESKSDPPNFFSRNLGNGVIRQITNQLHPYPQLLTAKTELLTYKRNDGTLLSGKLYLPPGYSVGDGLLPVIIWAYPNEYKSSAAASQVKDSPNTFARIGWWSPLFWLTQGFAVLDDAAMPIIGEGNEEPNDTFIEQLVANAEAAINCLDSMAIVDKGRVAIGGHSYGAFMAANLLAHSDLFSAGIARSGAYNRTLTPFGFQAEERFFWEAKDTYINMSPFSYAHKINEPLLLIHGDADNNSGTYPLQSERMFSALKGNGKVARLVMLPNESHSYRAEESILHMLWEMDEWLNKYVKNKDTN